MKKMLLLVAGLFLLASSKAQVVHTFTFTSTHITAVATDSMFHDSSTCAAWSVIHYVITVDTSFVGDTLNVIDTISGARIAGPFVNTAGVHPWTITTVATGFGSPDWYISPGGGYYRHSTSFNKVTTHFDTLRYMHFLDSIWVLPCLYDYVGGSIYFDNNSNCIFDGGDTRPNATEYPTITESVSSGIAHNYGGPAWGADYLGIYSMMIQKSWMTSYTVSIPSSYPFIFGMPPCAVTSYTFTTLPQSGVDFQLLCSTNVDVQCYALSPGRVRRLTPFLLHPYVSNTGCDTISGTMTVVKDSRAIYSASLSTIPADTVRGDTLIWNYYHLTNISSGAYWNSFMSDVYLTPDPTVMAGDSLCFRIYTNIPPADINPLNNDYRICLPVVYSYDPNSKDISPAGTGPTGALPPGTDTVIYTINFQNTGTAAAYNIKIIDTLDSHLDPSTFKILGTSHTMVPKWLSSNIIEFDYNNIMLPDSNTNEPGSHGQVRFSIGLRAGLPPGTVIKNTGYIYFDANPAVVTNTTSNTTAAPTRLPQPSANRIKVYPNPAADQLVVEGAAEGQLSVLSMTGSVLLNVPVSGDKTILDVSKLPAGIYMLRTLNGSGVSTVRFSKQ